MSGETKLVFPPFTGAESAAQAGKESSLSLVYITVARPTCFMFIKQVVFFADSLACAKTGNRIAAKIAMIAITTRSSIRVKPLRRKVITLS